MSIKLPGRTSLPVLSPASPSRKERVAPVLYAGGLLAIGAALLIAKPRIGSVPSPNQMGDGLRPKRWRRAALAGRNGVQTLAPTNVTDSVGRSLILGGLALLTARVLDELSGRSGQ